MRRSCFFLIFFLFVVSTASFTQPSEPATNTQYDSVRSLVEKTVQEYRDSLEREKLLQNIRTKGKPLDVLLAERKEEEKKEERRRWVRIGAGAIFLFALFYAIARRYRNRKKP